jgi:hypothetical protein
MALAADIADLYRAGVEKWVVGYLWHAASCPLIDYPSLSID